MRLRTLILVLAAVCAVVAATVAGPAAAATCSGGQTFAAWGDSAYYIQMGTVAGTNQLTSNGGQFLGGSGTATYSGSCTSFTSPQIRFFAKNTGNASGTLTVSVQYKDANGSKHNSVLATLNGSGTSPSPILNYSSGQTIGNVQVTVTANGGNWQVNGVYIDPFRGR